MLAEVSLRSSSGLKMTFDEIYKQNSEIVLNLAYRMTGKEEVARDLTQDVFLKVYENQDSFREQAKISTWIYKIAMNHVLNYVKREKRVAFFDFLEKDIKVLDNSEDVTVWEKNSPKQPDEELEDSQKETIVRKLINELSAKYRIPFLLFRYEDMSYQEIADKLNISLSAVESQIHRAKNKLAIKLKPWIKHLMVKS